MLKSLYYVFGILVHTRFSRHRAGGRIKAVGYGKCTITATTWNGKTVKCVVTVPRPKQAQMFLLIYKKGRYCDEYF